MLAVLERARGGGFFAIWPADSGPDCAAGKRRHKRNRRSPLNPGGGAVTLEQGNTGALIYLLRRFIRTPLTAAGPFVLLILAIKHACRGRSRIGWCWRGVWGGCYYFERRVFMEKSNARPPSATFYHTAILGTKELKASRGRRGEYLLKRHLNKQLKKEGLSRMTFF